ncbi:hypothetical protein BKA70DRAFT_870757 [Coprinopsis sp. MPI-PUGE-AT-0042]|nr:hypothetical protein BKA70DRAFT_870757 [Coprinopsis sp. MPI-PUGE-AT-0042]
MHSTSQKTDPFPFGSKNVTRLDIYGGSWQNVEGNSITLNNCNVFMTRDGQISQTMPLSQTRLGSARKQGTSQRIAHDRRMRTRLSDNSDHLWANPSALRQSVYPSPAQFLKAKQTLEDINQLISPHTDAIGIFKRIEPHLRDLETLVGFASTAYTACGSGTVLGNIVRAAIDTQMEQCNGTLFQLLGQIKWLPYRLFPRAGYAYSVVHEWWTGHEPEEIRAIRLSILKEVTAIGEWLRSLHS